MVKQPQAVLPTENLTLTLLPATPRTIFRPFCSDATGILYVAVGQKERWMPMASYRPEWVDNKEFL